MQSASHDARKPLVSTLGATTTSGSSVRPSVLRMGVRRWGWAADWVERARCKGSNEVGLTMHSHDARCRWRALAASTG